MSTTDLDRTTLDGKDREQLHAIAGAMGVKAPTRMRKAELIDAIMAAANGDAARRATATASRPVARSARHARPSSSPSPSRRSPPRRTPSRPAAAVTRPSSSRDQCDAARARPVTAHPLLLLHPTRRPTAVRRRASSDESSGGGSTKTANVDIDPEDVRESYGDGNQTRNRRRRRRGRGGQDNEPRREQEPVGDPVPVQGLLELRDEGYGFLRTRAYLASPADVYVSASQVRRFGLRKGDFVEGFSRPQASNEKYPALLRVDTVNAMSPEDAKARPRFEDLTPLFPDANLRLEMADNPGEVTGRIIDLISPIGKGQRGLIVSPPKAGKTTILKQIVYSIERNNPEVHLMVALVDERPEEVTDMKRHVQRGEVVASTFDRPSEEHTAVAELTIERAKRLVEMGKDVVIVLDGITRLARAYNLAAPASGRILSGGVDSTALYPPKRFFGAARNIEEGGSLTVIATALVDTGSRMDEVIFEEFKGTGNMELRLDRKIAERRIYPAIDVEASSTRHEELLFERDELNQVWKLRRVLNALDSDGGGSSGRGLDLLLEKLKTTQSNAEFLAEVAKAPSLGG